MKFIKNIDKFHIKGSATLRTYLITIAKNTYVDYLFLLKMLPIIIDDEKKILYE